MTITHGTDRGPACVCGSTTWGYAIWSDGYVSARCVGCHRSEVFYVSEDATVDTHIREIREAHEAHASILATLRGDAVTPPAATLRGDAVTPPAEAGEVWRALKDLTTLVEETIIGGFGDEREVQQRRLGRIARRFHALPTWAQLLLRDPNYPLHALMLQIGFIYIPEFGP